MKAYGALSLTDSSPAQTFEEPLELDEVKEFLRVSGIDQDRNIIRLIAAARAVAEAEQKRDLIRKQYDLRLDIMASYDSLSNAEQRYNTLTYTLGPGDEIPLRNPLASVDLFQYTDSDGVTTPLVEDTDFLVDLDRSQVTPVYGASWPSFIAAPSSAVLIRFTSGYSTDHPFWGNAGQMVKQGMAMLITLWYEERLGMAAGADQIPYGIKRLLGWGARNPVY